MFFDFFSLTLFLPNQRQEHAAEVLKEKRQHPAAPSSSTWSQQPRLALSQPFGSGRDVRWEDEEVSVCKNIPSFHMR